MGKISRKVACATVTLEKLNELVARRTTPSGRVQRAKILLACIDGETVQSIVNRLHVSSATVMRWKGRFIESGLNGLEDKPRSGRPTHIDSEFKQAVLQKLEQSPPEGFGQWNCQFIRCTQCSQRECSWQNNTPWRKDEKRLHSLYGRLIS